MTANLLLSSLGDLADFCSKDDTYHVGHESSDLKLDFCKIGQNQIGYAFSFLFFFF